MSAPFPSLLIRADRFEAQGSFAEAQAAFLQPDAEEVRALTEALREKKVGIVAHFYMDPELQGVLSASDWPHIQISDSLQMADRAIDMVRAGVRSVIVLGVDFMSENVRAMLDAAGFAKVPVFRVSEKAIGCSLAQSAESLEYGAWLTRAARTPRSLHVVYINTSLRTKAQAHAIVPTITCTSSNVVQTVLQAFAQIPDATVWYGPDTYMGANLARLFETLQALGDDAIRAVHPAHDRTTMQAVRDRFHYFEQGVCIVHHMFGSDVAARVRAGYPDAFVTAHLEVPGEMFEVALEAQQSGRGVVGSTSDILGFIGRAVDEAVKKPGTARLRFVLGTETGMVTSIVRRVRSALQGRSDVEVEIVFPVASEAIAQTGDRELSIVPGVAAGEGCSIEGGCATCPYMKMNSLDALMGVLQRVEVVPGVHLAPFEPKKYAEMIAGRTAADLGGEPILHMRAFQKDKALPPALVRDVIERGSTDPASAPLQRR